MSTLAFPKTAAYGVLLLTLFMSALSPGSEAAAGAKLQPSPIPKKDAKVAVPVRNTTTAHPDLSPSLKKDFDMAAQRDVNLTAVAPQASSCTPTCYTYDTSACPVVYNGNTPTYVKMMPEHICRYNPCYAYDCCGLAVRMYSGDGYYRTLPVNLDVTRYNSIIIKIRASTAAYTVLSYGSTYYFEIIIGTWYGSGATLRAGLGSGPVLAADYTSGRLSAYQDRWFYITWWYNLIRVGVAVPTITGQWSTEQTPFIRYNAYYTPLVKNVLVATPNGVSGTWDLYY